MSGLTKSDREYWIKYLMDQLTKKVDASRRAHQDEVAVVHEQALCIVEDSQFGRDIARFELLVHDLRGIKDEMEVIRQKHQLRYYHAHEVRHCFDVAVAAKEEELLADSGLLFVALEKRRESICPQLMLVTTTNQMSTKVRELMHELGMSDVLERTLSLQEGD